jgi:AcrR family transcriptional regulator
MDKPTARDRLAQAAFDLFKERGYEQTTIDDIAERAGLSRATFFRHYRSKEDVIFPDHDRLLERVRDRLRTTGHGNALAAAADAVRLVLLHYLDEGDLARRRYALTSTVPALRDREIVSVARYQRLFREYIAAQHPEGAAPAGPAALQAELMAAAVASAHNHVLRRWLRGESTDPVREVDDAMRQVISLFAPRDPEGGGGATLVAFRTSQPLESLIPAIQTLLETQPASDRVR